MSARIKVMVSEREEVEIIIDFAIPYRVRVPTGTGCEINLGGEISGLQTWESGKGD